MALVKRWADEVMTLILLLYTWVWRGGGGGGVCTLPTVALVMRRSHDDTFGGMEGGGGFALSLLWPWSCDEVMMILLGVWRGGGCTLPAVALVKRWADEVMILILLLYTGVWRGGCTLPAVRGLDHATKS